MEDPRASEKGGLYLSDAGALPAGERHSGARRRHFEGQQRNGESAAAGSGQHDDR